MYYKVCFTIKYEVYKLQRFTLPMYFTSYFVYSSVFS